MTKTIIGLWGKTNVGKTTTLAALGKKLITAEATTSNNINHKDYRAIFQYQTVTLGIQTFGDYPAVIRNGLSYFGTQCDILVMATRSSGGTVTELQRYAKQHDYRLIWATPLQLEGSYSKGAKAVVDLKEYSADQLLVMINHIIAGTL